MRIGVKAHNTITLRIHLSEQVTLVQRIILHCWTRVLTPSHCVRIEGALDPRAVRRQSRGGREEGRWQVTGAST